MRSRQALRAALAVGVFAVPTVVAVVLAPAASATSVCAAPAMAVVVDFRHWPAAGDNGSKGNVVTACVPYRAGLTGYGALTGGGFTVAGTQHDGPGLICRIDNLPAPTGNPAPRTDEPCALTPPNSAYWSYWHADPGATTWTYSQLGAMSYQPVAGSVDAWVYGATDTAGSYGQPGFSPGSVMPSPPAPPADPGGAGPADPTPAAGGGPVGTGRGFGATSAPAGSANPRAANSGAAGSGPTGSPLAGSSPAAGTSSGAAGRPPATPGISASPSTAGPRAIDIDAVVKPAGAVNPGRPWATLATGGVLVLALSALAGLAWRRRRTTR